MSGVAPEPAGADGSLERTALKEWAVLTDAMGRGDIIAMVRKGGIREQRAGFTVRHDRFLLYPTWFHEKADELAERFTHTLADAHTRRPADGTIRIELVADVIAVWRVTELDVLRGIAGEHGLAWNAVESRFRYRDRPEVRVVAARVSRLVSPVSVRETRRYAGCVSWLELDDAIDVSRSTPVVSSAELDRRVKAIAAALSGDAAELELASGTRAGDITAAVRDARA